VSGSWKVSLPCTLREARALEGDVPALADVDPAPVLMTSETVPDDPDAWRLDAYFEEKPGKAMIAMLHALVPSAGGAKPVIEQLGDEDWLTMSQAGIEPVRAGRFFVHTAAYADAVPPGLKSFHIEAGLAFGTGQHETTTGCLLMLDAMKRRGHVYRDIIDVGTGTGLLAFAARHLWPHANVTASDIDPISIDVTRENAAVNDIPVGVRGGQVALAVAPGVDHPLIWQRGPYDLVVANILAGPLIDLAESIVAEMKPRGTLILAGLLDSQAARVIRAYRRHGMRFAGRIDRGDWPTLRLVKRPAG
jgi:ribosomal protein L11 methyltransferase